MCFDCLEDKSEILIKDRQLKEEEERKEKEAEKKKQKEMLNDPRTISIFNLARELTSLREKEKPQPIGVGNLCNRYVYEYSLQNQEKCPRCGSKVKVEYESLELNYEYEIKNGYQCLNRPGFMCDTICYFIDEGEKSIDFIAKKCQKKDENGLFYLAINGKKYPLLEGKDWLGMINDIEGFNETLQRSIMHNYDTYPALVGSGGDFFSGPKVHVYICNSCEVQYHMVSLPCFIHRDKSKDGFIEEKNN